MFDNNILWFVSHFLHSFESLAMVSVREKDYLYPTWTGLLVLTVQCQWSCHSEPNQDVDAILLCLKPWIKQIQKMYEHTNILTLYLLLPDSNELWKGFFWFSRVHVFCCIESYALKLTILQMYMYTRKEVPRMQSLYGEMASSVSLKHFINKNTFEEITRLKVCLPVAIRLCIHVISCFTDTEI